jgi:arylsulfatase A-like enzyme
LLMDSFYVFQICSPTRSALVSGRYPFHVSQSLPEGFHAISRQYELLPALLKRSGNYRTYHIGKWRESTPCQLPSLPTYPSARNRLSPVPHGLHLSDMGFFNESYTPHGQGFDHSFGFLCACHDVNHWNEGGHFTTTHACTGLDIWTENGPAIGRNGTYSAELYGAAAVDFVHQHAALAHASSPMYLQVEYFVPHAPTNPGPPSHYIVGPFEPLADRVRANYSGMVVSMDQALGNLTDALKSTGMWEDTLLVLFGECVNQSIVVAYGSTLSCSC